MRVSTPILFCLVLAGTSSLLPAGSLCANLGVDDRLLAEFDRTFDSGLYSRAETVGRRLLPALDSPEHRNTLSSLQVRDRFVEILLRSDKGATDEALELARATLAAKSSLYGAKHPETARSLVLLARVEGRRGDFAAARNGLETALEASSAALGNTDPLVAEVMHFVARLEMTLSNYTAAGHWAGRSLAIRREEFGELHPEVASSLSLLGDSVARSGDFTTALPILRHAAWIHEKTLGPDHPDIAPTLGILAMHLTNNGEFDEARRLLARITRLTELAFEADSPRLALPMGQLATLESQSGNFAAAERLNERVLQIELAAFGPNDLRVATTSADIGEMYLRIKAYPKALEFFERAEQIYESLQGPWSDEVANQLNSRGIILSAMGRYEEAQTLFERSIEIFIHSFGNDSPNLARCLNYLAQVHLASGKHQAAEASARKALEILARFPGMSRATRVDSLDLLASSLANQGQAGLALLYEDEALAEALAVFGAAHPRVAAARISRASLLMQLGRRSEATLEAAAGEAVSREHLVLVARSSAESQAVAYASNRESGLGVLASLSLKPGSERAPITMQAWDSLIRARALVLDELATRRRVALDSSDPESVRRLDELARASGRLANLVVRGPSGDNDTDYAALLAAARAEKDRAERAVAQRSEAFRARISSERAGFADLVSWLAEGDALVGFMRYPDPQLRRGPGSESDSYAAFVLASPEAEPLLVPLGSAAVIDDAISRWRKAMIAEPVQAGFDSSWSDASYQRAASELRSMLWDPVAARLQAPKRVFLVPDAAINLVNFAALPTTSGGYLAEEGIALHYFSAERDLIGQSSLGAPAQRLLVISNPDFESRSLFAALRSHASTAMSFETKATGPVYRGPRSACGSFKSMTFDSLPATYFESGEVVARWQGSPRQSAVDSFAGASATESVFKQQAGAHRVLHLATHGFFLGAQCSSGVADNSVVQESPLLLSGLALAGANHRSAATPNEDDGILTAEEISTLDLRGTEWAVLSACDTGMGEIRASEGVFGLRRAFQIAGARSVIMSLWPVEDESTREWMAALYRHRLIENESTIDSVHHASLDMLNERRARGESTHPFYWAGFIAAGDWR
jgi:CHAT domain-containing protein